MKPLVATFTDFGLEGPYLGQVKAVLHCLCPEARVIDLIADAPAFAPKPAAYLLAAYGPEMPEGTVLLCVVDPGVGGNRRPMAARVDGRWYVGPDNGLFEPLLRRAGAAECFEITWRPQRLSCTFHGRDLFAPVAGRLARGEAPAAGWLEPMAVPSQAHWPDDLAEIVYVDHYGNAMTGIRAATVPANLIVEVAGRRLSNATTYSAVSEGQAFWYANSSGLLEIAVSGGRADRDLAIGVGTPIGIF